MSWLTSTASHVVRIVARRVQRRSRAIVLHLEIERGIAVAVAIRAGHEGQAARGDIRCRNDLTDLDGDRGVAAGAVGVEHQRALSPAATGSGRWQGCPGSARRLESANAKSESWNM